MRATSGAVFAVHLALASCEVAPGPGPAPVPEVASEAASDLGPGLGRFEITYYWIAEEADFSSTPDTELFDMECRPLALVPAAFARSLAMEGTGRLTDGRLVNFDGRCICNWPPCLVELDDDRPFGLGVDWRPLTPFRSIAVDGRVMPTGTRVYAAELDGLEMPGDPPWGGWVHDGCLVADDRGSAIEGLQIDFFVAYKPVYRQLLRSYGLSRVTLFEAGARCR